MLTKSRLHKLFLLISAALVLHGTIVLLIAQGAIALRSYTVQSNLLFVFGFCVMAALGERRKTARSYLSFAVLICISITGIVYNFILVPFSGQPMVLIGWGNFVTHLLSMLLAIVNYFVFEEKRSFTFRHIWSAIIPTLLYWIVSISIGPLLGYSYPYFFMTPWLIGWFMVFFWFFVILIFVIGLTLALVFFDNNQKKHALLSLGLAGLICTGLVLAFGDGTAAPPPLIDLSHAVEDVFAFEDGDHISSLTARQLEEGIALEFDFFITEARMHPIHFGMQAQDMIAIFLLTDTEIGEVLLRSIDSEIALEGGLLLNEGAHSASWLFFESYESIQHFFTRMGFEDISPEASTYFQEVLAREGTEHSAYISFVLW